MNAGNKDDRNNLCNEAIVFGVSGRCSGGDAGAHVDTTVAGERQADV